MKYIKFIFSGLFVFLSFSLISSCVSKKERCEQVAFAMYQNGFIDSKTYRSQSVQNLCIYEWDTKCIPSVHGKANCDRIKNNEEWRDCILDASSKAEMNACGAPYMKPEKFR